MYFPTQRLSSLQSGGHHGSPSFPTISTCCSYHALAQPHCPVLGSRSNAKVKQGPVGKYHCGKDSLFSSPISDFAGERNAAMLGMLKGRAQTTVLLFLCEGEVWKDKGCSLHWHATLSCFKYWLEGNALATGLGEGSVIPCGDQKGRCVPESVWYQLSFLLTAIFKCQLLDLLPTAGSASLMLQLHRGFGCGLLWSLWQKWNVEW